jgi:hypothetical protein
LIRLARQLPQRWSVRAPAHLPSNAFHRANWRVIDVIGPQIDLPRIDNRLAQPRLPGAAFPLAYSSRELHGHKHSGRENNSRRNLDDRSTAHGSPLGELICPLRPVSAQRQAPVTGSHCNTWPPVLLIDTRRAQDRCPDRIARRRLYHAESEPIASFQPRQVTTDLHLSTLPGRRQRVLAA